MEQIEHILLQNHLSFLATHRGSIQHEGNDIIYIASDRPEFTYALLGQDSKIEDLRPEIKTLQQFPWNKITRAQLLSSGFQPTLSLL